MHRDIGFSSIGVMSKWTELVMSTRAWIRTPVSRAPSSNLWAYAAISWSDAKRICLLMPRRKTWTVYREAELQAFLALNSELLILNSQLSTLNSQLSTLNQESSSITVVTARICKLPTMKLSVFCFKSCSKNVNFTSTPLIDPSYFSVSTSPLSSFCILQPSNTFRYAPRPFP